MLPDFFVVGAAKSGTTSLDRYLSQHPDIFMASPKEPSYFAIEDYGRPWTGPLDNVMYSETTVWDLESYERLFEGVFTGKTGDSSPYYLYYPGTAQRIKKVVPSAQIIIMLRNPVSRAYSAYLHLVRDGREKIDFMSALDEEEVRKQQHFEPIWYYKELGNYAEQVIRYFEVFGEQKVKVILFEEFIRDTETVVREILGFLELSQDVQLHTETNYNPSGIPTIWYHIFARRNTVKTLLKPFVPDILLRKWKDNWADAVASRTLKKPPMTPETRNYLKSYFHDNVRRLEQILGRDLGNVWGI